MFMLTPFYSIFAACSFSSLKFTQPTDSSNANILFLILFTILGMSAAMTLIGDIVGNGFSTEIFSNWVQNWPCNFVIVLIAKSLVIQPIARFVMVKVHESQDEKAQPEINAQAQ